MSTRRKTIPTHIREKVLQKYGYRCAYCGEELNKNTLKIDHIHPVYRGGTDDPDNLNPACHWCNFYKSTYTVDEFREKMRSFHERYEKYADFNTKLAARYEIVTIRPWTGRFYFEARDAENNHTTENMSTINDFENAPIIRTLDPLPEPEPDWLDAPAVLASHPLCADTERIGIWLPSLYKDGMWELPAQQGEFRVHWSELENVAPLYPLNEGTLNGTTAPDGYTPSNSVGLNNEESGA